MMKRRSLRTTSKRPSKRPGTRPSSEPAGRANAWALIRGPGQRTIRLAEILRILHGAGDPAAVAGMARFGINPHNTLGVSIPLLRRLARENGIDHTLAAQLWKTGIHEARILASLVDDPVAVSGHQMDRWARAFDSWDVCDQCCANLFDKTPFAYRKAFSWSNAKEEFVRRAGFVLMARLAVSDKHGDDRKFERFLGIIERRSTDPRNYVKKAVNWALRQIGKRNLHLNTVAIRSARRLAASGRSPATWIASDALRELTSERMRRRLVWR